MEGSPALRSWKALSGTAPGRWLFSRLVCLKAPYFGSISPVFDVLEPGRAVARIRKRRAVTNHIGTVHAIAMANLCELVAGTVTEVSVPRSMRWIPRSMTIEYLARAGSNLVGEALMPAFSQGESQDIAVPVVVTDERGQCVVRAEITMYLSPG
ncbi:MAG TPA: hotdog fold domain-containing protein [Xanthomonadales bacterium]|nr:hotdog fold domain-containing protein [Xanthomonadales bacterium]